MTDKLVYHLKYVGTHFRNKIRRKPEVRERLTRFRPLTFVLRELHIKPIASLA